MQINFSKIFIFFELCHSGSQHVNDLLKTFQWMFSENVWKIWQKILRKFGGNTTLWQQWLNLVPGKLHGVECQGGC